MTQELPTRYWILIVEGINMYILVERLASSEGSFIAPDIDSAMEHCLVVFELNGAFIRFA